MERTRKCAKDSTPFTVIDSTFIGRFTGKKVNIRARAYRKRENKDTIFLFTPDESCVITMLKTSSVIFSTTREEFESVSRNG